jgi:broad specificity phosphatase PhoE
MLLKRTLILLLFALGLLAQETTIVLLRHAERISKHESAELNSNGRRRAAALVSELAPLAPVALFATEFTRTQQTLEPLSRRLGLPVQVRSRGEEQTLAKELLKNYRGKVVIVCSHSDRLAPLLAALGHPNDLAEVRDYDRLWLVRMGPQGPPRVDERLQKVGPRQPKTQKRFDQELVGAESAEQVTP